MWHFGLVIIGLFKYFNSSLCIPKLTNIFL